MSEVLKVLVERMRDTMIDIWRQALMRQTAGTKVFVDAIIVTGSENRIVFEGQQVQGAVPADDKAGKAVRRLCGENILMVFGAQKEPEKIPHLVLVPTLSMLQVLGPKLFWRFLKNWPGNSTIKLNDQNVTAVTYSVLTL